MVALICILLLSGCSSGNREVERGIALRDRILAAEQCSFDVNITADYGDKLHLFSVSCVGNADGSLTFTVTEPETIAGITGELSDDGGKLTFEDNALHFDPMAEGLISPVSSPWVFFNTLRSGYIVAGGTDGDLLRLTINDSYQEDAFPLDIWLDSENNPVKAEILYENRRIIGMDVINFHMK